MRDLVEEMERLDILPTPKTLDALLAHVFERFIYLFIYFIFFSFSLYFYLYF